MGREIVRETNANFAKEAEATQNQTQWPRIYRGGRQSAGPDETSTTGSEWTSL